MGLTTEQRKELETHGAMSIRFKLTQYGAGRGASISGFKCGDITRGDIEDYDAIAVRRWGRFALRKALPMRLG